jgi:PAS domain S-box-containing protein
MAAARKRRLAFSLLSGASPASMLVRRLLPATLFLPLLIGLLRVGAERAGFISATQGVLAVSILAALGATALLLWTASSLERADRERRRAEDALRNTQQQHRALARHFPAGAIVLFDHDLRHVIADGSGLEQVGLSAETMEGRTIWQVFPREVAATIEPPYRAALAGRESTFEYTWGGRTYFVRVVPVQDERSGTVWGGAVSVQDVTEAKHAELELREASERFARIFENAPIGEAIVAPDGRFLRVNRALCELVGYPEEELVEKTFQEITHPEDLDADLELLHRVLQGELRTYQLEKRYFHKLGHIVWILLSVSLVRDAEGEPLYFISQIEDITERKRDQEMLRESEARLAEAQKIARLGSWEWRVRDDVVVWSDELCRLFDVEPGRPMTYDDYLLHVHPADREPVAAIVREAYESGEPFRVEHRVVHADGSVHWILGHGEVVFENGHAVRMRGTAQDITEQKDADEKRREAEARYRTLVEQLPLAMYIRPLDMGGSNLYVGPQVEAMLGYPAEQWETDGGLLARIVHPDDVERVLAEGERVRRTGEPFHGEYRYIARDGRVVWVQDETYLLHDDDGNPSAVQGFLLDISERKQAEAERDRLQAELHRAQKIEALGQLAGGVAHEFNNMLMAIRAHGGLVLERLDADDPLRSDVEQIVGSADRAAALTRQLLALGRKQVLKPAVIDVNDVVRASVSLLSPLLDHDVELVTSLDPTIPATTADAAQVQQVVVNLVLNARDAIPGRGTIKIRTDSPEVDEETAGDEGVAPGRYVRLSVEDTGSGMDDTVRARIFEPFFTTKATGSGLGLATAQGIVHQGGGFLTVDSDPGTGTTMAVYLTATEELPEVDEAAPVARVHTRRGRAVVVDDEPVVRDVCARLLEGLGYAVQAVSDGAAALALFESERRPVELLLTDVVMPGLTGPELALRVSEIHAETKVLYMSGYTGEELSSRVRGGGELIFLQKPFTAADLAEKVGEAYRAAVPADADTELTCVVADDHPAVLDAACGVLEQADIRVLARATEAEEAIEQVKRLRPHVAIVDVAMAGLGGIESARRMRESSPSTRVLLYTGLGERELVSEALAAGAQGLVLKGAPVQELVRAVRIAASGGVYVDRSLAGALVPDEAPPAPEPSVLTSREQDVLRLLAEGNTNDQAGKTLSISPDTVQTHVRNAMKKLGAETRTQAVAAALRRSLIS